MSRKARYSGLSVRRHFKRLKDISSSSGGSFSTFSVDNGGITAASSSSYSSVSSNNDVSTSSSGVSPNFAVGNDTPVQNQIIPPDTGSKGDIANVGTSLPPGGSGDSASSGGTGTPTVSALSVSTGTSNQDKAGMSDSLSTTPTPTPTPISTVSKAVANPVAVVLVPTSSISPAGTPTAANQGQSSLQLTSSEIPASSFSPSIGATSTVVVATTPTPLSDVTATVEATATPVPFSTETRVPSQSSSASNSSNLPIPLASSSMSRHHLSTGKYMGIALGVILPLFAFVISYYLYRRYHQKHPWVGLRDPSVTEKSLSDRSARSSFMTQFDVDADPVQNTTYNSFPPPEPALSPYLRPPPPPPPAIITTLPPDNPKRLSVKTNATTGSDTDARHLILSGMENFLAWDHLIGNMAEDLGTAAVTPPTEAFIGGRHRSVKSLARTVSTTGAKSAIDISPQRANDSVPSLPLSNNPNRKDHTQNSFVSLEEGGGGVPSEFVGRLEILRPFTPKLEDEIEVTIGDVVRVLKTFKDGWAYVAKLEDGFIQKGLIPLDCLRSATVIGV